MSQDCIRRFVQLTPPRPAMDCRPIIREWLDRRGVSSTPDRVNRWLAIMEQWEASPVFPFTAPALKAVGDLGVRMGVVSNTLTAAAYLRRHFEEAGILTFFDVTVFSAEFGISKPHPSIFQHALDALAVDPKRAWYVGDKPQRDIRGAHAVGMTAILVDSAHAAKVADAPENRPDLRIRDISELPGVIREAQATPSP